MNSFLEVSPDKVPMNKFLLVGEDANSPNMWSNISSLFTSPSTQYPTGSSPC